MKNVFVYQFPSAEKKGKFKDYAQSQKIGMHDLFDCFVDQALGLLENEEVKNFELSKKRESERSVAEEKNENDKREYDYKEMEFNKMLKTPEELEKWNKDNPDKMIIVSAEARKEYQDKKAWKDNLTLNEKIEFHSGRLNYPDRLKI